MLQTETEPIAERDSHGPRVDKRARVRRLDCRIESGNETAQPVARIERSAGQAHPVVTRVFFHISKEGAPLMFAGRSACFINDYQGSLIGGSGAGTGRGMGCGAGIGRGGSGRHGSLAFTDSAAKTSAKAIKSFFICVLLYSRKRPLSICSMTSGSSTDSRHAPRPSNGY